MTGVIDTITYKHATGGTTGDLFNFQKKYSTTFTIQATANTVGPLDILAELSSNPNYPFNGRPYTYGNGGADYSATCKAISVPTRVAGSLVTWTVEATYESEQGEEDEDKRPDEDGKKKTDPVLWHDEIEVSYTQFSGPADYGRFAGFLNGESNPYLKTGKLRAVCNSALVPFDPKPEREFDLKIIRISRNVPAWDGVKAETYQSSVNSSFITIDKPKYRFKESIGERKGKIKAIGGQFKFENNVKYWHIYIEVHINPLGWRAQYLDKGLDRLWVPGLPDGKGGTISASDVPRDGAPSSRPILDPTGEPITEAVRLNGRGVPCKPEDNDTIMEWSYNEEIDWSGIPW